MFIGNKPVVVMLHIKKDQRRLQKLVMKETLGNGHAGQPRPGPYNLQQAMHLYQSNHMQGAPHHQTPGHSTGPFGIMRRSGHGPNSGPLTGPYANQNLRTNAYNGRDNVYNNERSEYDLIDAAEYGQQMRKLPYASREPVWDGYKSPHGHHDSESYRYPNSSKPASPQGSQRSEQFEADLFAQRERREQLQYEQLRSPHSAKPNSNLWSGSSDREIESNQDVSSVQDQLQWLELGSPSKSLSKSSLSPSISEHGNWTTNSSPKCVQSTPIFDNVFGSYPPANHSKTSRPVGPESGVGYPSNGDQMLPEINLASRRPSYISIDERLERNYERTQLFAPTSGPFTTDSGSHRPHSPVVARPAGLSVNTNFANSNSLSLLTDPSQIYQVSARLLQLIEVQTPIGSARKITDYLVQHAPHSELLQLLENPDLLLSHYIAAAISKMGHSRN